MPPRARALIALAALALFVWLAILALRNELSPIDAPIRAAAGTWASPALTWIIRMVTTAGSEIVLAPWGLVLIWRWAAAGRRRDAVRFAAIVLGAEVLTQTVKLVVHRSRPEVLFGLPAAGTFSYPSGHAVVSTVFYGMLISIVAARQSSRGAQAALWISTAMLLLAVGFSRVYLGYHFPSDVLGGYAGAIALLAVTGGLAHRLP